MSAFSSIFFALLAYISRARRWILLINSAGYNLLKNAFYAMMRVYSQTWRSQIGEVSSGCPGQKEKIPVDQLFGTVVMKGLSTFYRYFQS